MSKTAFNYDGIIATADTNSKYHILPFEISGQYYITLDCPREIGGAFIDRSQRGKLVEWLNGFTFDQADIAEGKGNEALEPDTDGVAADTVPPVVGHKFRI